MAENSNRMRVTHQGYQQSRRDWGMRMNFLELHESAEKSGIIDINPTIHLKSYIWSGSAMKGKDLTGHIV